MRAAVSVVFGLIGAVAAYAQHSEIQRLSNGHPLQCRASSTESGQNQDVFRQLNQYRISRGLNALSYDQRLEECIEAHCHHMSVEGVMSHTMPEPQAATPFVRARECGTTASAENVARGQANATIVMNAWKNSPGHNANMLNGNYTRVGCGFYNAGGPYWGQLFGTGQVTQQPTNTPPPPGGGGGGTPTGSGGGGATPNNLQPSPAGPTSDPYTPGQPNNPSPNASSVRQVQPEEKKIVKPGLLKR
jgi:uncharacterized protein YkwD